MKKFTFLFLSLALIVISSCGGDNSTEENTSNNQENTVKKHKLKGYEELDLNPWGFELSIKVPNATENGEPEVLLTERGALEISVGRSFGLEIMFGEGDIKLLKSDLKDNMVFNSEIIKDEPNALIYTQTIPNSGVKPQNHFFYKAVIGNDIYEVRDLIDGEYGIKLIEKMLDAAKTIKLKKVVNS